MSLCSWEGDILFLTGSGTFSVPSGSISGCYPLRGGLGSELADRSAWYSLLALLLEADPIRCAPRVDTAFWDREGSRLQSTQKGLVSLEADAVEAAFASQFCCAGWCYKVCEQYGKAKEQNIILKSVFLETWSMVLGIVCCSLLVLCPTWK